MKSILKSAAAAVLALSVPVMAQSVAPIEIAYVGAGKTEFKPYFYSPNTKPGDPIEISLKDRQTIHWVNHTYETHRIVQVPTNEYLTGDILKGYASYLVWLFEHPDFKSGQTINYKCAYHPDEVGALVFK